MTDVTGESKGIIRQIFLRQTSPEANEPGRSCLVQVPEPRSRDRAAPFQHSIRVLPLPPTGQASRAEPKATPKARPNKKLSAPGLGLFARCHA
jgi:hypothetical protein